MPDRLPPLSPAALVRAEARALEAVADRLESSEAAAFQALTHRIIHAAPGHRVILSGIGKSGLIAQKIAATLCSTGTPAHFLHAGDALHGDLGMVLPGDTVLLFSSSGETPELLALLPLLRRIPRVFVAAVCGCAHSSLARAADSLLDASVPGEACPHDLVPTASTTAMLALGDALALTVSQGHGFTEADFARLHPGGRLGRRLARVEELMHTGEALPTVGLEADLPSLIHEMSHKKLGMTLVLDAGKLAGIISDGDLRRLLERDGAHAHTRRAGEIMNPHPVTIPANAPASEALSLMERRKITSVVAVTPEGEPRGVLHLHDLWVPGNG